MDVKIPGVRLWRSHGDTGIWGLRSRRIRLRLRSGMREGVQSASIGRDEDSRDGLIQTIMEVVAVRLLSGSCIVFYILYMDVSFSFYFRSLFMYFPSECCLYSMRVLHP